MASIQVTATASGSTSNGIVLRVFVLTGASGSVGPNTWIQSQNSASVHGATANTTQTGSVVYGALVNGTTGSVWTPDASTTIRDTQNDATNSEFYGTCNTTNPTGTPGSLLFGTSAPSNIAGGCAGVEILPAGTITENASGPAFIFASGAITVQSAAFTPPAGSFLVALVASDGGAAQTDMTVSGGGLTWTAQAEAHVAGADYAGVWTAQVPASSSSVAPARPGKTWLRQFKHHQRLRYIAPTAPTAPPPNGNQPGGIVSPRRADQIARAFTAHIEGSPLLNPAGDQPNGLIIRRVPIRSVIAGLTAHAQYNGSQPGGVVAQRSDRQRSRAVVGNNGLPGDGQSSEAFPNGKLPPGGIVVKRRLAARAVVGNSSAPGDGQSGPFPVGQVNGSQPGGFIVNRRPVRSLWAGITSHVKSTPGHQPGGAVYRRRPARAVVGNNGQSGDGFSGNAFPNGRVPPPSGVVVSYRRPVHAFWHGITGTAFPNGAARFTAIAVKRRSSARAVVGSRGLCGDGTAVQIVTSTTGGRGSLPPGGIAVKRRAAARAVVGNNGLVGDGFSSTAQYNGHQPGGVVYRRRPARAVTGSILGPPAPQQSTTSGAVYRLRPVRAIWAGITSTAQYNGSIQPRAAVIPQRSPLQRARAVSARAIGRAFYNGTPPNGVVYRRKPARALVGNNLQPGDGFAGRAFYNGSQPGGVVYRRHPARAVWAGNAVPGRRGTPVTGASVTRRRPARAATASIIGRAFYNGSEPGGVVYRRRPYRAVVGNNGQPGDGFAGQAIPPNGARPNGVVYRRRSARAVVGNNGLCGDGFSSTASYNGAQPHGFVSYRRPVHAFWHGIGGTVVVPGPSGSIQPHPSITRRSSARAFWLGTVVRTVNASGGAGTRPGGVVYRRGPARAVTAHATSRAFYNGSQPGGVVYRRKSARAVTGGFAGTPAPQQSTTSGVVIRLRPVRAIWAGITATAYYNGSIQPRPAVVPQRNPLQRARGINQHVIGAAFPNGTRPSGVVYRRGPARAKTGPLGILGAGTAGRAFYNGHQPGGVVYRRKAARANIVFTHGLGAFPPPSGTTQPRGTIPVPRRSSARAVWAKISAPATQAGGNGTIQPRATIPVPRRAASRAVWAKITSSVRVLGPKGSIQPRATIPIPRRMVARLVAGSIHGQNLYPPGSQPGGLVKRRYPARAYPLWEVIYGQAPLFGPPPFFETTEVVIAPVGAGLVTPQISATNNTQVVMSVANTVNVIIGSTLVNVIITPTVFDYVTISDLQAGDNPPFQQIGPVIGTSSFANAPTTGTPPVTDFDLRPGSAIPGAAIPGNPV